MNFSAKSFFFTPGCSSIYFRISSFSSYVLVLNFRFSIFYPSTPVDIGIRRHSMYHSAYFSHGSIDIKIKIRLTLCDIRYKCSDLRECPTCKIRLTHRKSIGFVGSGPGPRKFIRLVKNPTYPTPTYASLTVSNAHTLAVFSNDSRSREREPEETNSCWFVVFSQKSYYPVPSYQHEL